MIFIASLLAVQASSQFLSYPRNLQTMAASDIQYRSDLHCGMCILGGFTFCIYGSDHPEYSGYQLKSTFCCETEDECSYVSNPEWSCSSAYSSVVYAQFICPFSFDQCGNELTLETTKFGESKLVEVNDLRQGETCFYRIQSQKGLPSFQLLSSLDDQFSSTFVVQYLEFNQDEVTYSNFVEGEYASDSIEKGKSPPYYGMPPRNSDFIDLVLTEVVVPQYEFVDQYVPRDCNNENYTGEVFSYCLFSGGTSRTNCVKRTEAEDLCQERNCYGLTSNLDCLCDRADWITLGSQLCDDADCSTNSFTGERECTCPAETYPNYVNETCSLCTPNCTSCTNSSVCLECISEQFSVSSSDGTCQLRCSYPSQYYNTSTLACEDSTCPAGSYFNWTTYSCKACMEGCEQCASGKTCETCAEEYKRATDRVCYKRCQDTNTFWNSDSQACEDWCESDDYYYNLTTETCKECPTSCPTTCHGDEQCDDESCEGPRYVPLNGACVDACSLNRTVWVEAYQECQEQAICDENQFYEEESNECLECHANCEECESITQCTLCEVPYVLKTGSTSTSCDSPCTGDTIIVPSTLTCESVPTCESDQYYDAYFNDCYDCPQDCATCEDNYTCTSCLQEPQYQVVLQAEVAPNGEAVQLCQDLCSNNGTIFVGLSQKCEYKASCTSGQYYDSFSNTCPSCRDGCKACTSLTACTECVSEEYTLTNGICSGNCTGSYLWDSASSSCKLVDCGSAKYYNETYQTCMNCDTGCLSCENYSYQCQSCDEPDYQLVADEERCEDVCADVNGQYDSASGECVCEEGQFENSLGVCQSCSTGCLECTSATVCTKCLDSMVLSAGKCSSGCPSTQYYSNSTGSCVTCASPCTKCLSSSYCTECVSSARITFISNQCLDVCVLNGTSWNYVTKQCYSTASSNNTSPFHPNVGSRLLQATDIGTSDTFSYAGQVHVYGYLTPIDPGEVADVLNDQVSTERQVIYREIFLAITPFQDNSSLILNVSAHQFLTSSALVGVVMGIVAAVTYCF